MVGHESDDEVNEAKMFWFFAVVVWGRAKKTKF